MTWLAVIVAGGGILLVRLGWGGRREVAWAGWLAAAAAWTWLAASDGAWGFAVGATTSMAVAMALLLHIAVRAPAKAQRAPREAPAIALPRRWRDLGRRLCVFVLIVPVAFIAAAVLAFGVQALARRAGAEDADTFVLMLLLQPGLWAIIMAVQITRASPARMLDAPAAAGLAGAILCSVS